jgi:hypothetical protein
MGNFIKSGGTSDQFLRSDGTAYSQTYFAKDWDLVLYKSKSSLTINSKTNYFWVYLLIVGGYVLGVRIIGQLNTGSFPGGKHGYAKSASQLITESKYRPSGNRVDLVYSGQHLGGTSYMTLATMDSNGYVYCYGVSNYSTSGSTTANQFYNSSGYDNVEAFYFITPVKYS